MRGDVSSNEEEWAPHLATQTGKENLIQVAQSNLGSKPLHIHSLLLSTQSSWRLSSLWAREEGCPWWNWCTSSVRKGKQFFFFLDSKASPVGLGFYWFIHGKATALLLWQTMDGKGGKKVSWNEQQSKTHGATDAEYCSHLFWPCCVNDCVNLLVSQSSRKQLWHSSTMEPNWR